MKAICVIPGKPNSIHLREVPKPRLEDVPHGRGVLVKILRVGVDGTDKEINAAEYGAAPPGDDYLILGHESLGQVEEMGRSEEHTSELQSQSNLVCRLLLEKKKKKSLTTNN